MKLEVTYKDGKPTEIVYHSMVYGLMKFDMEGSTAVVDPEWNEITRETVNLKDKYEMKVHTEDVVEEVEELPFVQAVEA